MKDDTAFILRAIGDALRARIAEIQQDEIAAANRRVAERVAAETDKIALNLLARFSVEDHRGNLLITVRKELS